MHAPAQLDDQNHAGKVHTITVTPDGSTAVSVAADGCAMVWDVQSGGCRHTLKGHAGALHWACLASDGRTLLTVAGDRMVKIWDCITGSCSATLPSRRAPSVACCGNESAWWSHLVLAGVLVPSFRILRCSKSRNVFFKNSVKHLKPWVVCLFWCDSSLYNVCVLQAEHTVVLVSA